MRFLSYSRTMAAPYALILLHHDQEHNPVWEHPDPTLGLYNCMVHLEHCFLLYTWLRCRSGQVKEDDCCDTSIPGINNGNGCHVASIWMKTPSTERGNRLLRIPCNQPAKPISSTGFRKRVGDRFWGTAGFRWWCDATGFEKGWVWWNCREVARGVGMLRVVCVCAWTAPWLLPILVKLESQREVWICVMVGG